MLLNNSFKEIFFRKNVLKLNEIELRNGYFESTGTDPWFLLKASLKKGWHIMDISLITEVESNVKIYFKYKDSDYSEANTIHTYLQVGKNQKQLEFYLKENVDEIRFDVLERPGVFMNISMKVKSFSEVSYYLHRYEQVNKELQTQKQSESVPFVLNNNNTPALTDYQRWINKHETLPQFREHKLRPVLDKLATNPKFSIILPTYNTEERLLREAIESVQKQIYTNWELCIADDNSPNQQTRDIIKEYADADSRIKYVFREENGHISHCTNSGLELVTGDWVVFFDHDDLYAIDALAEIAIAINNNQDAKLIYSDEDLMNDDGTRHYPHFKPDWNEHLFYSYNYITHIVCVRKDILGNTRLQKEFDGAQDYAFLLEIIRKLDNPKEEIVHIPKVLYHWRMTTGSTAAGSDAKPYASLAGKKALENHFRILNKPVTIKEIGSCNYKVTYNLPEPEETPLVSLIIPTRDGLHLLEGAVSSILEKTTYNNYEIVIVDNGSEKQETLDYLDLISQNEKVQVLKYNKPFNYSAINNYAIPFAKGEIIGLINNDVLVIEPDWLSEMVSYAMQPEIGCVGAKLYYKSDRIQHAGVIMGIGGTAGHAHKHFDQKSPGYFNRLNVPQNLLAVTAACLLVKKSIYNEVNGLDEEKFKVAYNDVDFCLKVHAAGYNNIYTPDAKLYHLESESRGYEDTPEKMLRLSLEGACLRQKWFDYIEADPYYSPNLTLNTENFAFKE